MTRVATAETHLEARLIQDGENIDEIGSPRWRATTGMATRVPNSSA
jgi:hypothetical protein